jgi:hypothetical protein
MPCNMHGWLVSGYMGMGTYAVIVMLQNMSKKSKPTHEMSKRKWPVDIRCSKRKKFPIRSQSHSVSEKIVFLYHRTQNFDGCRLLSRMRNEPESPCGSGSKMIFNRVCEVKMQNALKTYGTPSDTPWYLGFFRKPKVLDTKQLDMVPKHRTCHSCWAQGNTLHLLFPKNRYGFAGSLTVITSNAGMAI